MMNYNQKYFVHLISCALLDEQPREASEDVDWRYIYKLSTFHSVFTMLYSSLLKLKNKPSEKVMEKLKKIYALKLNSSIQKDDISEQIIKILTSGGIKTLPFKGYYIKRMYPKMEYRYVSDLDIITSNQKRAVELLAANGFKQYKDDMHHTIMVKNAFACEVHKSLFVGELKDKFENPLKFSHEQEKGSGKYIMDDNYFYAAFIAHFAYHFLSTGCGIRSVCDLYLLNKNLNITDKSLIEQCGLGKFESQMKQLSDNVFGKKDYDEELMEYILASHTSGDKKNGYVIDVAKHGKNNSLLKRFFPSFDYMSRGYAIKSRAQLPLFWVIRFAKSVRKGKSKLNTVNEQAKVSAGDEEKYRKILNKLGIKEQ